MDNAERVLQIKNNIAKINSNKDKLEGQRTAVLTTLSSKYNITDINQLDIIIKEKEEIINVNQIEFDTLYVKINNIINKYKDDRN